MKMVVMGDLHYHEYDETVAELPAAHSAFYESLLNNFLELDADFHISLGDLTHLGTARELQEVYGLLRRVDRNFIHVLGNHDLYAQTRDQVLEISGQQRYHHVDTGEAVLAFLDTAREQDFEDWGGFVDEEQLRWLETVVQQSGSRPLLVFGHHPLFDTTARSTLEKCSIHPDIDMWSILAKKQGTGVYFNGHTHVDSIVSRDNWTFVQLAACLDVPAFRAVELTEDEVRIHAVEALDEEVAGMASLLHTNMKYFRPMDNARGMDADRETVVAVLKTVTPA